MWQESLELHFEVLLARAQELAEVVANVLQ